VVRLDVSEDGAADRVEARAQGRHLSDDEERNRVVWRAFRDRVVPARAAGLVVDTERATPAEVADAVCDRLVRE
jgi:hypothetical protein